MVGSGIGFQARGLHELKGVPGRWEILAVAPEGAPVEAPEGEVARIDTPGTTESMGVSDRFAAVVARHAPGVLRVASRLGGR